MERAIGEETERLLGEFYAPFNRVRARVRSCVRSGVRLFDLRVMDRGVSGRTLWLGGSPSRGGDCAGACAAAGGTSRRCSLGADCGWAPFAGAVRLSVRSNSRSCLGTSDSQRSGTAQGDDGRGKGGERLGLGCTRGKSEGGEVGRRAGRAAAQPAGGAASAAVIGGGGWEAPGTTRQPPRAVAALWRTRSRWAALSAALRNINKQRDVSASGYRIRGLAGGLRS